MFEGEGQLDAEQRGPVEDASTNQQRESEYTIHGFNPPKP